MAGSLLCGVIANQPAGATETRYYIFWLISPPPQNDSEVTLHDMMKHLAMIIIIMHIAMRSKPAAETEIKTEIKRGDMGVDLGLLASFS